MHMMNDYCWTPNREAVSLPSLRSSVPSDSFKSHLAKPSFVSPTTGLTNASSKVANYSNRASVSNTNKQHDISSLNLLDYDTLKVKDTLSIGSSGYGSLTRSDVDANSDGKMNVDSSHYTNPSYRPDFSNLKSERIKGNSRPPLVSSVSSPSLYPTLFSSASTKSKKHSKNSKKLNKGNSISRSKSARETILRHILPFHSHPSPRPIRRGSSAESLSSSQKITPKTVSEGVICSHYNTPTNDMCPINPTDVPEYQPSSFYYSSLNTPDTPPHTSFHELSNLGSFTEDFSGLMTLVSIPKSNMWVRVDSP